MLGSYVFIVVITHMVYAAPAPTKTPPPRPQPGEPVEVQPPNTGLHYDKYLQEIVKLLESNEDFRKKMENADFDSIRNGGLSEELLNIPQDVREKLNAVKRQEVSRIRKIIHAKTEVDRGDRISHTAFIKQAAAHYDPSMDTFEPEDLTKLIKAATGDLERFDEERHKDFKQYEMNKDLRRQEKLHKMSQEDRKKAEQEYLEMRRKHEDHPEISHPGSKQQLDEIWKEEDGLNDENFDPRTFFMMHDLNGDGVLDAMELEALFEKDLGKVYNSNNPEDDMIEMETERTRMRQHVMSEVDADKDGIISIQEFLRYTDTAQFGNPNKDSYKTVDQLIDDEDLYTKEELEEFKEMIAEQEQDVKDKLEELKKQAQNVVSLKSDMYLHENKVRQMGENAEEHDKVVLQEKKDEVEAEEKILKEMHEDLKEQSKDIMEMKEEVKKQEKASQMRGQGEAVVGGPVPVPGQLFEPGKAADDQRLHLDPQSLQQEHQVEDIIQPDGQMLNQQMEH